MKARVLRPFVLHLLLLRAEAGVLGVVAFVTMILGTSFVCWIYSSDVTFVPVIAAESPRLFMIPSSVPPASVVPATET